jgi:hypothetical protein
MGDFLFWYIYEYESTGTNKKGIKGILGKTKTR